MSSKQENVDSEVVDDGFPAEQLDIVVGRLIGIKLREREQQGKGTRARKRECADDQSEKSTSPRNCKTSRPLQKSRTAANLQPAKPHMKSAPRKLNANSEAPRERNNQKKKKKETFQKPSQKDLKPESTKTARDKNGPRQQWKFRERRPKLPGPNGQGFIQADDIEVFFIQEPKKGFHKAWTGLDRLQVDPGGIHALTRMKKLREQADAASTEFLRAQSSVNLAWLRLKKSDIWTRRVQAKRARKDALDEIRVLAVKAKAYWSDVRPHLRYQGLNFYTGNQTENVQVDDRVSQFFAENVPGELYLFWRRMGTAIVDPAALASLDSLKKLRKRAVLINAAYNDAQRKVNEKELEYTRSVCGQRLEKAKSAKKRAWGIYELVAYAVEDQWEMLHTHIKEI